MGKALLASGSGSDEEIHNISYRTGTRHCGQDSLAGSSTPNEAVHCLASTPAIQVSNGAAAEVFESP